MGKEREASEVEDLGEGYNTLQRGMWQKEVGICRKGSMDEGGHEVPGFLTWQVSGALAVRPRPLRIAGAVCLSIIRQTLDYNGLIRDWQGTYSTTGVDIQRTGW